MNESESNPPKDTPKRMSLKSPVSPIQTRNLTMESIEPSPQTEEPTNTLHIVYARYNVFMRKDETDASIVRGYLCVTMSQDLTGFDIIWISRSSLSNRSASLLSELVVQTKCFDFWSGEPMPPASLEVEATDMLTAPLLDVAEMTIEPQLTLYRNEEACLPVLTVRIQVGNDILASWPSLWFAPIQESSEQADSLSPGVDLAELMRNSLSIRSTSETEEQLEMELISQPNYNDIVLELRKWLRTIQFDLLPSQEANVYQLTRDVKPDTTMDELARQSNFRQKWPDNLPRPSEDSTLYRLGAFGMGVMKTIVGRPIGNKIEDAGWGVLDRFSRVTHFARDKTTKVLTHPVARPIVPLIPEHIRNVAMDSEEAEKIVQEYNSAGPLLNQIQDRIQSRLSVLRQSTSSTREFAPGSPSVYSALDAPAVMDFSHEFVTLSRNYKAHVTRKAIKAEQWISWTDETGKLTLSPEMIKAHIFCKGLDEDIRVQAWKFVLGAQDWTSTDSDRVAKRNQLEKQYLEMKQTWLNVIFETDDDSAESHAFPIPENATVGDENEEMDIVAKFKERKHRIEKDVVRTDPTIAFFDMSRQAQRFAEAQSGDGPPSTPGTDLTFVVESNPQLILLRNVLMTYTVYGVDLGYVQGMSDLAAPIIATVKDEVESFWCFVGFMERMKPNFYRDQSGMKTQLRKLELLLKVIDPYLYQHFESTDSSNMFCCFRWLLILFKREFSFYDSCTLWEAIWTCPLTSEFHLFIAIAILNKHRQPLFHAGRFDQILKFVNNLSEQLVLDDILQRAEILFYVFYDRFIELAPASMGGKEGMKQSSDLGPILSTLESVSPTLRNSGSRLSLDASHERIHSANSAGPPSIITGRLTVTPSTEGPSTTPLSTTVKTPKSVPSLVHMRSSSKMMYALSEAEWIELVSVLERPSKG